MTTVCCNVITTVQSVWVFRQLTVSNGDWPLVNSMIINLMLSVKTHEVTLAEALARREIQLCQSVVDEEMGPECQLGGNLCRGNT